MPSEKTLHCFRNNNNAGHSRSLAPILVLVEMLPDCRSRRPCMFDIRPCTPRSSPPSFNLSSHLIARCLKRLHLCYIPPTEIQGETVLPNCNVQFSSTPDIYPGVTAFRDTSIKLNIDYKPRTSALSVLGKHGMSDTLICSSFRRELLLP